MLVAGVAVGLTGASWVVAGVALGYCLMATFFPTLPAACCSVDRRLPLRTLTQT